MAVARRGEQYLCRKRRRANLGRWRTHLKFLIVQKPQRSDTHPQAGETCEVTLDSPVGVTPLPRPKSVNPERSFLGHEDAYLQVVQTDGRQHATCSGHIRPCIFQSRANVPGRASPGNCRRTRTTLHNRTEANRTSAPIRSLQVASVCPISVSLGCRKLWSVIVTAAG